MFYSNVWPTHDPSAEQAEGLLRRGEGREYAGRWDITAEFYLQRQRGWTHRTLGLLAARNTQCPRKDSVFLTKHSSSPLLQHRWWVFSSPCLCQGSWAGFQDESSALAAKTGTFCWDAEQAIKNTKHLVTFIKCIKWKGSHPIGCHVREQST